MRAGIALGSNLGDRLGHLRDARKRLLALHDGSGPFLCSKIYETTPVNCPDDSPSFFNAAIELSTAIPPLDLLAELHRIETESGRTRTHKLHEPRNLDLDFLFCDNIELSHNTLILPHPRISERLFVLKPLSDICPDRILYGLNRSVRDLREELESHQESSEINDVSFCF